MTFQTFYTKSSEYFALFRLSYNFLFQSYYNWLQEAYCLLELLSFYVLNVIKFLPRAINRLKNFFRRRQWRAMMADELQIEKVEDIWDVAISLSE
jgi:hypothetical protein